MRRTAVGYARGAVGALIVAIPILMTMEMWWAGFFVPAWRLLLLFTLNFGVLLILQHFSGLHPASSVAGWFRGAVSALAIGVVIGGIFLFLFGVLRREISLHDVAGMVILQSIPLSLGASVAMSHFGHTHEAVEERKENTSFWGAKAVALAGAAVFGFGVAGTEEPFMIGLQMEWWRALLLMLVSLIIVHGVVYSVDFKDRSKEEGLGALALVRHAVTTYALALLVAAYLLWTFGRIEPTTGIGAFIYTTVALGSVTSLGAASGELLI